MTNIPVILDNAMIDALQAINSVKSAAQTAFIERTDVASMVATCMVGNKHAVLLGKPGTTKSGIISAMSQALGLNFRTVAMNPDISREELVGAIDPKAFANGQWDRLWSSLAVADIGFVDETGKASGTNLNILLGMMQERQVIANGVTRKIPLLSLFGASNEIFSAKSPAVWDRFHARALVSPVSDDNFDAMWRADIDDLGCFPVDREAIARLGALCKVLRKTAPTATVDVVRQLRIGLPNVGYAYVSDRRWRDIGELAAANALLGNRTEIEPEDLTVARWSVWDTPENPADLPQIIDAVTQFIENLTCTAKREVKEARAKLEALQTRYAAIMPTRPGAPIPDETVQLNAQVTRFSRDIGTKTGAEWNKIRADTRSLAQAIADIL